MLVILMKKNFYKMCSRLKVKASIEISELVLKALEDAAEDADTVSR